MLRKWCGNSIVVNQFCCRYFGNFLWPKEKFINKKLKEHGAEINPAKLSAFLNNSKQPSSSTAAIDTKDNAEQKNSAAEPSWNTIRGTWYRDPSQYTDMPFPNNFFDKLENLECALNVEFRDRILLLQALVSSSHAYGKQHRFPEWYLLGNERLALLGDSLLEMHIFSEIMSRWPSGRPEVLDDYAQQMRSNYVLGQWAIENYSLDKIVIQRNSIALDEQKNSSATALEAILAAIYLDQGLDSLRSFFLRSHLLSDIYQSAHNLLEHRRFGKPV